jgi:ATP-dependent DNA helicase RecG
MTVSVEQIEAWLNAKEDANVEFKTAQEQFDSEKIVKYCVALANEGGGYLVLGISDETPRRVCGTKAFANADALEKEQRRLLHVLHVRVEVEAIQHPLGRVVVFVAPGRPVGTPVHHNGTYWMRNADELVPMTPEKLMSIAAEKAPDFTGETCPKAAMSDLSPEAIQRFQEKWVLKSGNSALRGLEDAYLLSDAELIVEGKITYAALILFGTHAALGKHLSHSEVIFEFRSNEASIASHQRRDYREGFFLFEENLVNCVNQHNDLQHYQDGLFVWDIPTFSERSIREAILNAIAHRDYRHQGQIFIKQYPRRITISSPGGFPPGVTPENILKRSVCRNKRIAEAFQKCGYVERAGQGMDMIYRSAICESKPLPDFRETDDCQVSISLSGEIQDERFLRFLEKIGKETLDSFLIEDFLLLDLVRREGRLPGPMKERARALVEHGILESYGRGRGSRLILSRKFYDFLDQKGVYTRKRGLDRAANKELLYRHIVRNQKDGSPMKDLLQVLPNLTRPQVQHLLQDLKKEGRIHPEGARRLGKWHSGPACQVDGFVAPNALPGAKRTDSDGRDLERMLGENAR